MSVIEVEHLSKACGSTVAVAEVTFSVEEGEIFGILARTEPGRPLTRSGQRLRVLA